MSRDTLADAHSSEPQLSKLDVILNFNIEVIVMEARGIKQLVPTREIYCTMEIEGSETGRLQTEHVQAKKPLWDTQGDFSTQHPLPVLKIKLYAVNQSMLSLEDKELGKLVLRPTVLSPKTPEWWPMQVPGGAPPATLSSHDRFYSCVSASAGAGAGSTNHNKSSCLLNSGSDDDHIKIRVVVRMNKPQQLKHCGFLFGIGKQTWHKFRRRYHILIQVSQYTFVLCAYREKKHKPTEMLQLDGYTVDFIEPPTDLILEHCSEITTSGDTLAGEPSQSSGAVASTFGLAGRLAKPFLKPSSNSSASANLATSGVCQTGGQHSSTLAAELATDGAACGAGECLGAGGAQNMAASLAGAADQATAAAPLSALQTAAALSDELHNKHYFSIVKEGDSVVFACDTEQDCFGWVVALYRATGQAHKPTPIRPSGNSAFGASDQHSVARAHSNGYAGSGGGAPGSGPLGAGAGSAGGHLLSSAGGADVAHQRARKHGMDEFICADPRQFQHNHLFKYLQLETLKFRLADQYCSLGWLAPSQLFVLDEYCARYSVRTCYRHLTYLDSLIELNATQTLFIDHTLLNYCYDFCASFVSGQAQGAQLTLQPMCSVNYDLRPDGVGTVTVEERELFYAAKQKLLAMIERQITNFSTCFPFGKPAGALKAALSLLERVLMKQDVTLLSAAAQGNDEVRQLIKKCLEQAALQNYTKLSGHANLLAPANGADEFQSSSCLAPAQAQVSHAHQTGAQFGQPAASSTGAEQLSTSSLASSALDFIQRKRGHVQQSGPSSLTSSCGGGAAGTGCETGPPGDQCVSYARDLHAQQQAASQQQKCLTMAMIINNEHMRAHDKLRHLIRLAELCCEQVEECHEYFGDAFAWHSDLLMEHFELFWSLFSVDMDKILSELHSTPAASSCSSTGCTQAGAAAPSPNAPPTSAGQHITTPPGGDVLGAHTRDSFVLFLVLNSHMRRGYQFDCKQFRTYLCDTFKPKLLRYIDLMEQTLSRQLLRAFERDAQVNCGFVEQMFVRVDDVQKFVLQQLCWPELELAEQLQQRLKLLAYELCDTCVHKTLAAFQQHERRSNKWTATTTSYACPVEMVQMINLSLDTRAWSYKLCTFSANFDQMSYHSKIDKAVETALGEMQPGLMAKMLNALDSTLTKLARHDEGNLLAPILSITYRQGMSSSGKDIGKQYIQFVSTCCDTLRQRINDELWIVTLLEDWYAAQMQTICQWLAERIDRSLHDVQVSALANIMPKVYADMSLQGVPEDKLNLKTYQTIMNRLKMEEAAAAAAATPAPSLSSSSSAAVAGAGGASSPQLMAHSSGGLLQSQQGAILTSSATGGVAAPSGTPRHLPLQQQARVAARLGHPQLASSASGGGGGSGSTSSGSPTTITGATSADFASQNHSHDQDPTAQDNIADRALQSATRMFKGFWTSS